MLLGHSLMLLIHWLKKNKKLFNCSQEKQWNHEKLWMHWQRSLSPIQCNTALWNSVRYVDAPIKVSHRQANQADETHRFWITDHQQICHQLARTHTNEQNHSNDDSSAQNRRHTLAPKAEKDERTQTRPGSHIRFRKWNVIWSGDSGGKAKPARANK